MRSLGAITWAMLNDPRIVEFDFLRMVWPSPTGTLRWTTYPALAGGGVDTYNANIEGTAQDWDATKVWKRGALSQSMTNALGISDVSIGNADRVFSDILRLQGGSDACVFTVYMALYDKDTLLQAGGPTLIGGVQLFDGKGEREEVGDWVRVSLIPSRHPMLSPFPRRRYTPDFGFNFIPKQGFSMPWGGGIAVLPDRPLTPSQVLPVVKPPGNIYGALPKFPVVDPTGRKPRTTGRDDVVGGRRPREVKR